MTAKTILIVEDNHEISDMLAAFLSENGYDLLTEHIVIEANYPCCVMNTFSS